MVDRLRHAAKRGLLTLMRAHMGAYLADRNEAVRLCFEWCRELALDAFLDILSVRTSQLTQSHFCQVWAAVSALTDDIEPLNCHSPQPIHIVSFSEGSHLADPSAISENIKITLGAIAEYCQLNAAGEIPELSSHLEISRREEVILSGARAILRAIEDSVAQLYTARELYQIFAAGFLPVLFLGECRDEFRHAVHLMPVRKPGQLSSRAPKESLFGIDSSSQAMKFL